MLNYFGVNLVILSFSTIKKILYSKNTVEFSSVKKVSVKKKGFPRSVGTLYKLKELIIQCLMISDNLFEPR